MPRHWICCAALFLRPVRSSSDNSGISTSRTPPRPTTLGSDSGAAAVGWDPFFTNYYHESTVHTPAEIIRKTRFLEGVGRVKIVVNSLCAE